MRKLGIEGLRFGMDEDFNAEGPDAVRLRLFLTRHTLRLPEIGYQFVRGMKNVRMVRKLICTNRIAMLLVCTLSEKIM